MSADTRTDPQSTVPVEPRERSCVFCRWSGEIGATAHATLIHPDEPWVVVVQMGREFVVKADAARASQPITATARPEIVCLCGSTRFYDAFQEANYDLTMAGKIVLSVGFYPHSKAAHGHGEGVGHDSTEKVALDELHKRKIDLADRVFVLNVGGYIGDSTRSEIEYAESHGKPVGYLE